MKRKLILTGSGLLVGISAAYLGWLVLPENFLGAFVIFTGLAYCIGGAFALAFGRAPQQISPFPSSDRTLLYLAPGSLLVLLAAPLEYHFLPPTLPRSEWMQWLGIAILILGFAIRVWTRLALKGDYQGNLQVRPGQPLINSGPFQWVRHPGYLGFIVSATGLVVGFSSLAGMLGIVPLSIGFLLRSQVEERMLIRVFGEQYITYAKHTGRMVPRIHNPLRGKSIGKPIP
jgi:protein-S-isoprenylcysteine O-methyltransferase Ste14